MSEPLYGHHNGDYVTFGEWYAKHVDAMTAEGLHSKTAIAWELAYRDETIVHLQAKLTEAQKDAERYRWLRDSHPADPESMWVARGLPNKGLSCWRHEPLDAAIDAALAKEQP